MKDEIKVLYSKDWADYEILDTGEGEKLERVGKYKFVRPLEDAVWQKTLQKKIGQKLKANFLVQKRGRNLDGK